MHVHIFSENKETSNAIDYDLLKGPLGEFFGE